MLNQFWARLDRRARIGFLIGLAALVALTVWLANWILHRDYQVLFADLTPQDAATMVAELDHDKIPYRIGGDGNTILVPEDLVYKTRLKLVGKDLPLHGTVGFELFNNADFGMTEFAQKVNYQRALQGEITRTILSIDEVASARVHLALPDQGLFKKSASAAKASITLGVKPGRSLRADQVQGIQRLVAAAIPDVSPQDVTVVDQHGMTLTRNAADDGGAGLSSARLDMKRGIEEYLTKKVSEVLDQALGKGQGVASVDVVLNYDNVKTTTEDVVPADAPSQHAKPTGVVVRERRTARDGGLETSADGHDGAGGSVTAGLASDEVEYQVGRRVQQVVSSPGSIEHLSVAAVVNKPVDQAQLDRIKDVVALAVGYNRERGDAIAVYSLDQVAGKPMAQPGAPVVAEGEERAAPAADNAAQVRSPAPSWNDSYRVALMGGIVVLLAAGVLLARRRSLRQVAPPKQLTHVEREALLQQVQNWIQAGPNANDAGERG